MTLYRHLYKFVQVRITCMHTLIAHRPQAQALIADDAQSRLAHRPQSFAFARGAGGQQQQGVGFPDFEQYLGGRAVKKMK